MKAKILSIAMLGIVGTLPVQAQSQGSGWYGELGYLGMSMKNDYSGGSETVTPSLARFVIGKEVTSNIAVEGMAGLTLSKATVDSTKVSNTMTGFYLKPFTNLSTDTQVFARLGYASNSAKAEGTSGSSTWSSSQPSYGFGIQTMLGKDVYAAIDYMDYGKKTFDASKYNATIKYSGFTLSVGTRF